MELEDVVGYKWNNKDGKCFYPVNKDDSGDNATPVYRWKTVDELMENIKYTFACTFLGWDECDEESDEGIFDNIKIDYDPKHGRGEVWCIYDDHKHFEVW